jgi:tungstate transport system substrate-binding protein
MNRQLPGLCLAAILALVTSPPEGVHASSQGAIILATTTSTQDSGLLDMLVPRFEKERGIGVKVIAVGSGAALRMAATGDADAVLVHAPDAEKQYVDAGDLVEGRRVMHNDFVIVGPPDDPSGVGRARSVVDAMRAIAARGVFISRGDDSGTHRQELALWSAAGIDPRSLGQREETGQGMGATLTIAGQKRGYSLTDRGTYLALRKRLDLAILSQGDPSLLNVYHVYLVNPDKHRGINVDGARAFVAFLVSEPIQRTIGDFRRQEYGEPLFFPDALPVRPPGYSSCEPDRGIGRLPGVRSPRRTTGARLHARALRT